MSPNAECGLPEHDTLLCLFMRPRTSQLHAVCTLMASWLGELTSKSIIACFVAGRMPCPADRNIGAFLDSESRFVTQFIIQRISKRRKKMVTEESHAEGSLLDLMDLLCSLAVPVTLL